MINIQYLLESISKLSTANLLHGREVSSKLIKSKIHYNPYTGLHTFIDNSKCKVVSKDNNSKVWKFHQDFNR